MRIRGFLIFIISTSFFKPAKMCSNLEQLYRVLFLVAMCLELLILKKTFAVPRRFAKFWNNSLMLPSESTENSLVMQKRSECVSWCVMTPQCCCTQWILANNMCTILVADRAGLSNRTGVVSSIDRMIMMRLKSSYYTLM